MGCARYFLNIGVTVMAFLTFWERNGGWLLDCHWYRQIFCLCFCLFSITLKDYLARHFPPSPSLPTPPLSPPQLRTLLSSIQINIVLPFLNISRVERLLNSIFDIEYSHIQFENFLVCFKMHGFEDVPDKLIPFSIYLYFVVYTLTVKHVFNLFCM